MKYSHLSLLLTTAATAVAVSFSLAPVASAAPAGHSAADRHSAGAVFVQTDDLDHNAVIAYDRASNGQLTKVGTVFGVDGSWLTRRQVLPTHGDLPVSVGVSGNLVYVLNARDGGSITGFKVEGRTLVPLAGSTRALNLAPNANPEFLQAPRRRWRSHPTGTPSSWLPRPMAPCRCSRWVITVVLLPHRWWHRCRSGGPCRVPAWRVHLPAERSDRHG